MREAEAAFRRLAGSPHSLSFLVDYALTNYREPARQMPLGDALAEYLAAKTREHAQHIISAPHLSLRRHPADLYLPCRQSGSLSAYPFRTKLCKTASTAAESVVGRAVRVLSERGEKLATEFGAPALITLHPSALLRLPDGADPDAEFVRFVTDLRRARP